MADKVAEGSFLKWFLVDETWRCMFASELVPGTLFLIMAFFLPESPRWLVKTGRSEQAGAVLSRILKNGADEVLADIQTALAAEQSTRKRFVDVFYKSYRKPLIIAMLLAAFAQFSGINVVFYYGIDLLEKAGFKSDGALSGMAKIKEAICSSIECSSVRKKRRRGSTEGDFSGGCGFSPARICSAMAIYFLTH